MAKWGIPEGRKPLTDADIAALTRRLAGTAVDYKELYEAAKRDAEEAEAYAEELEAGLAEQIEWVKGLADDLIAAEGREARLKEKLAKAVQFTEGVIRYAGNSGDDYFAEQARTTLAELTGGKDE